MAPDNETVNRPHFINQNGQEATPGKLVVVSDTAAGTATARHVKSIRNRHRVHRPYSLPVSTSAEVGAAQALSENASAKLKDMFMAARVGRAISASTIVPVVSEIHASIRRNSQAFNGLMRCKLRNETVYQHSLCVGWIRKYGNSM